MPSLASRQNAPATVQPLLSAFPLPNGPDLGNGTAAFSATYSNPSSLDSYGIRIDHLLSSRATIFGRYNDVPSEIDQRGGGFRQTHYSSIFDQNYRTQTLTLGSNQSVTPRLTSEFRFNYSRSRAHAFATLDNFGGAVAPANSVRFRSVPLRVQASIFWVISIRTVCVCSMGNSGTTCSNRSTSRRMLRVTWRTPDEIRSRLSPKNGFEASLPVGVPLREILPGMYGDRD